MALVRDTYYQALYERLQAKVPGINTWTRKHLHFARIPAGNTPIGLVLATNQTPNVEAGLPTVWNLGADLVFWIRTTGQEESLDTTLNELVDSVEAALSRAADDLPPPGPFLDLDPVHTTLGGLVAEVTISGPVELNQEEGAEFASVVIPIDMVVLGT